MSAMLYAQAIQSGMSTLNLMAGGDNAGTIAAYNEAYNTQYKKYTALDAKTTAESNIAAINQDNDGCTGPLQPVNIGAITSIATSLGALAVTQAVLEPSAIRVSTESLVVSDEDAVCACEEFFIRQRTLVEPACGAAIAAIFAPHNKRFMGMRNVVVVACGGSVVNWSLLRSWKDQLGLGELRVE